MAQIKKTDIYEGGNPFEAVTDGIEKLTIKEKELIASNKALQDSYANIAKTNDGKQARELVDITEKLTAANKQLETVQKAKITLTSAETDALIKLEKLKQAELNTAQKQEAAAKRAENDRKKATHSNLVLSDSLNGMRLELRNLIKEYDNLSKEQRDNSVQATNLKNKINSLNSELAKNESLTGRNQRNVGNYRASILEAIDSLNLYNNQMVNSATGLIGMASGAGKVTAAMKVFRIALASTGIGLLVIALGTLYTYFTKYDEGMEKIERATAAAGAVMNVFFERVIGFGSALGSLFGGIYDIAKSVGQIVVGLISFDYQKISDGLTNIAEGGKKVADSAKDTVNSFKGMGKEMTFEAKQTDLLTKKLQELEDTERELTMMRAKQDKELAEARETYQNKENVSASERLKAIKFVAASEKELANLERKFAADKYNYMSMLIGLQKKENVSDAQKNELASAYNELQAKQADSARIIAKNLAQQRAIEKELSAEREIELKQKNALNKLDNLANATQKIDIYADAEAQITANLLAEDEKRNKEAAQNQSEAIDSALEKSKKAADDAIAIEKEKAQLIGDIYAGLITTVGDEFKTLIQDSEASLGDFLRATVNALIDSVEAAIIATQIKLILAQFEAGGTLNFAKLASSTAAIIGVKILAGGAKALISKTIPKERKFADGVIGLEGKGTGRSDSISAKLSKGESVISAYPTSKSIGLLTAINSNQLTDATAPQYFNNSTFESQQIVSKLDETNTLLRNGGFAFENDGFLHIQKFDGSLLKIKIDK